MQRRLAMLARVAAPSSLLLCTAMRTTTTTTQQQQPHDALASSSSSMASTRYDQRRRHDSRSSGSSGGYVQRGPSKDRYAPMTVDLADPRRRLAVLVDGTNTRLLQRCSAHDGNDSDDSNREHDDSNTSTRSTLRHSVLYKTVLPAALERGVPVLLRVFAHELSGEWHELLAGADDSDSSDSSRRAAAAGAGGKTMLTLPVASTTDDSDASASAAATAAPMLQAEYFRVERFIPIAMQMEADAQHIFDFCAHNKIEGVCYVCNAAERDTFVRIMQRQLYGDEEDAEDEATASTTKAATTATAANENSADGTTQQQQHEQPRRAAAAFFNQYVLDETGKVHELTVDSRSRDGA